MAARDCDRCDTGREDPAGWCAYSSAVSEIDGMMAQTADDPARTPAPVMADCCRPS